jgi:hypothetical protein
MLPALLKALRRVITDISAGRQIEAYALTLIALGVTVATMLDDALSLDIQMAVLLAGIGLLVFKTTVPVEKEIDLDRVLLDRQSYGAFRDFIRGGHELLIAAPSAVNVLMSAPDIEREILDRGGKLRVLLQDIDQTPSVAILHQQLDKMSHLLENDVARSTTILDGLIRQKKQVDYRLAPFSPGYSLIIIDPDGRDGRLIVEFFGYSSDNINDRMHIEIHRHQSQYWFEYWAKQYEIMWDKARDHK